MRAWQLSTAPGRYELVEIPTPSPSPGEVRVRLAASGLNHLDLWVRDGTPAPTLPHVGGADGVGVVDSVGAGVNTALFGARVVIDPLLTDDTCDACRRGDSSLCVALGILGEHRWGTFAQAVVLPSRNVVRLPETVSDVDGAAFGLVTMTALRMITRARLEPQMRVLITGAGGGVAAAAIALCVRQGACVVASSRRSEVLTHARRWGASETVVPGDTFDPVDVVFDSVGPDLWPWYVRGVKPGGRIVMCGSTSGPTLNVSIARHFFAQQELIGSTMGSHDDFAYAVRLVSEGLRLPVSASVPFEMLEEALGLLEHAKQVGKVVLLGSDTTKSKDESDN